ncbi:MAG: ABC transporter permease [Actinomycetia bacterium]|nr:ABC transporter permease [Actinomycetes bacterium]
MTILTIALTDLLRLVRERVNLFFFVALPLVLILVLGSAFGGFEPRIGLVVDDTGPLALELAQSIEAIDTARVTRYQDLDDALENLRRDNIEAAVVIPTGYDADLRQGQPVELGYLAVPDSGGLEVRGLVDAAVTEQASRVRAAHFVAAEGLADFDTGLEAAEQAGEMVSPIEVTVVGPDLGEAVSGDYQSFLASQELVLFTFITSLTASASLIQTRRLRIAARMLSTPTTTSQILAGMALGRYLIAFIQGVFILLASSLLFGVNWGSWPAALALVATFSLVGTGAAVLMGSVFSNEEQAGPVGVFVALAFAALGGCMVPLEIFSDTMRRIAHITPHAWANDGFSDIIRQNGQLADIGIELGVLLAYGTSLLALATFFLRRSLTR